MQDGDQSLAWFASTACYSCRSDTTNTTAGRQPGGSESSFGGMSGA